MEVSKKDRVVRRAIFTKKFNELDLLLSSEGKCLSSIKVVWEILQQKYSELQIVDEKIYNMLLEDVNIDEATLAEEMERTDEYLRKFTKIKVRIDELNAEDKAQSEQEVISGISQPSNTSKRKYKLPVIEFKRFNGDVREWLGFWAQFRKIHEDPDIDEHDKIIYLIQATEIGSKARQLVESYPAMQENYSQIIDSLKARFGREDILIEVYVRELLKLILKNTTSQEKTDISTLYDKVESYLRALETLGITKNKCAPMLFPLIESCLPENLLRAWQRCSQYTQGVTLEDRLNDLLNFLKAEVESEQRISMATESFGFNTTSDKKQFRSDRFKQKCMNNSEEKIATASGLVNFETKCVFCEASHDAQNCSTAKRFSFTEKKETLSKKGACYKCLKVGHVSRKCHAKVRCLVCDKTHVTLMCPEIISNRSPFHQTKVEVETKPTSQVLACQTASQVFMQTIMVTLSNGLNSRKVRALMDTGSQRSYILKSTAQELGLVPLRTVILCHALFGGKKIAEQPHNCYKVKISNQHYSCHIEVLDQHRICSDIEPIYRGEWYKELAAMNIHISDVGESGAIEILFGADIIGNFYTGRRHVLKSGLVAIDTLLGWTLMGKVLKESNSSLVISMLIQDASISNLWELDILGITDPTETKNREELALNAKKIFEETVIINEEGRYEVQLPWIEEHLPLPSNYTIAKKRLQSTLCKL